MVCDHVEVDVNKPSFKFEEMRGEAEIGDRGCRYVCGEGKAESRKEEESGEGEDGNMLDMRGACSLVCDTVHVDVQKPGYNFGEMRGAAKVGDRGCRLVCGEGKGESRKGFGEGEGEGEDASTDMAEDNRLARCIWECGSDGHCGWNCHHYNGFNES